MVVDDQEDQLQGVSVDASMGAAAGTGHQASGSSVISPLWVASRGIESQRGDQALGMSPRMAPSASA
jgi:hypothetical protein